MKQLLTALPIPCYNCSVSSQFELLPLVPPHSFPGPSNSSPALVPTHNSPRPRPHPQPSRPILQLLRPSYSPLDTSHSSLAQSDISPVPLHISPATSCSPTPQFQCITASPPTNPTASGSRFTALSAILLHTVPQSHHTVHQPHPTVLSSHPSLAYQWSSISCYSPCRTNSQPDRTRLLILIGIYRRVLQLQSPGSHFTVYSSRASSHSSYLALDGLQNNSRVQATANVLDLSRSKTLFHSSQHRPNSFIIVSKSHPTVFYSHITQFQGPTSKFLCHISQFSILFKFNVVTSQSSTASLHSSQAPTYSSKVPVSYIIYNKIHTIILEHSGSHYLISQLSSSPLPSTIPPKYENVRGFT